MIDRLLRYGIVFRRLGPNPDGTILDVGAGPEGLGACLPYKFVGVDTWYPEPPIPAQQAVRGSALRLPFADQSFDHVLCIEVLEHIKPEDRSKVVEEMFRVARKQIIITHPYGTLARAADHFMMFFYWLLRLFGKDRPWWLVEHLQNPYPNPRRYLPSGLQEWHAEIGGQENVFAHLGIVIVGNLKILARRIRRFHSRRPASALRMVRIFDFPPYCKRVVILSRKDA